MNVEYINPGDLDRRITIVRPYRSRGDEGQKIVNRVVVAQRFASIDFNVNDEDVEDSNVMSVGWLDITMYRLDCLEPTDEIEFEGKRYNIMSISEIRLTPFIRVRAREVLNYEEYNQEEDNGRD